MHTPRGQRVSHGAVQHSKQLVHSFISTTLLQDYQARDHRLYTLHPNVLHKIVGPTEAWSGESPRERSHTSKDSQSSALFFTENGTIRARTDPLQPLEVPRVVHYGAGCMQGPLNWSPLVLDIRYLPGWCHVLIVLPLSIGRGQQ